MSAWVDRTEPAPRPARRLEATARGLGLIVSTLPSGTESVTVHGTWRGLSVSVLVHGADLAGEPAQDLADELAELLADPGAGLVLEPER